MGLSRRPRSQRRLVGPLVLTVLSVLALCLLANVGKSGAAVAASGSVRHPAHITTSGLRTTAAATALAANATGGVAAGGVLGDVTGDGLADILAIDPAGNMWLYPNAGNVGADMFSGGRSKVGSGWSGYTLAAVAPLYGAARAGILALDGAGSLWYYPNTGGTGTGTFGARGKVGSGWNGYYVAGLADLLGTGAPGILAISPADPYVAGTLLYFPSKGGTGLNTFTWPDNIGPGWTGYTADLADINGDGKPDILAADSAGNLWLYPNTGSTASPFAARSQVGSGWSSYQAIDVGELTSAGPAGILAIDRAGNLWLYPNTGGTGTSTFGARVQVGSGWTGYRIN